jgi:GT2 family glycosyltransferase
MTDLGLRDAPSTRSRAAFARADEPADVAVLVVTYRNAGHVDRLIATLRDEGRDQRLRVVVADNASDDGTLEAVRAHADVVAVPTGGNLGYAGGINVALEHAGDAAAVLVLNPDLEVAPGCVAALRARLAATPDAGAVVPRFVGPDGSTVLSLRNEPSLRRALGDALLGSHLPGRPAAWSEMVFDRARYERPGPVDWATGAAVLLSRAAVDAVGPWDERFFLYSEETDYLHRVRGAGFSVWYEPAAVVRHEEGGSGRSVELDRLMAVNRVRYARKHRRRPAAAAYRGLVVLHEAMRAADPGHRTTLRTVAAERSWSSLLQATPHLGGRAVPDRDDAPGLPADGAVVSTPPAPGEGGHPLSESATGAVIIPAHEEEAVIGRTLGSIAPLAALPGIEVVVVANGSTDRTAAIARGFEGVRVIELAEASKTAALNAGDAAVTRWPRLYLDADIDVDPAAVLTVFDALGDPTVLAARPRFVYDVSGATAPVRGYYRARARIPVPATRLWGAGGYAVGERGHERFTRFPAVTADDSWFDAQFPDDAKRVVATAPMLVRTPRDLRGLLAVLVRQRRGYLELGIASEAGSRLKASLAAVRGPRDAADMAWYVGLTLAARRRARQVVRGHARASWERDASSRTSDGAPS